ncbi:MAG: hypothetical protein EBS05_12820 [Proteobacteria bacterium]|nr:hypothetical protein [Pseudomonadota bacterium]
MIRTTLLASLSLIALPFAALGSPSGLNNIPTADTAPDLIPVIQEYTTFGAERKPDHTAGMKIGFGPWDKAAFNSRFEAGVDGHFAPGDAGPPVFQVKYAVKPFEAGPDIGLGSANLAVNSGDRKQAGQPFSYLVLSQDFSLFRAHAGYGVQQNGNAAFVGVDKTFKVFERDLTVRSDATQIQDQRQWLASVGAMYAINSWVVAESWASFPVETGKPTLTLKLNFVLDWKKKK